MIFFETAGQARMFLFLLYAGFLAGPLYDLLGIPRRRLPRFFQPALDALWCLLTGGMTALALAMGGERQPRLFALLGLACGAAVYGLGVRRLIRGIGRWMKGRALGAKGRRE
ncbi:MAG: spore cortex biosynthesis protein YabQ [Clostridia bacterium]|nr:spore cortex biosynthesis protein YabQ [Clostridia bacterium]MBR0407640.1 spore cortex biosynthesis protein YabQ [Clostridia bacterium]